MKRFIIVALALMMVATVCAGCRRADKKDEPMATTTVETTPIMTTTAPTTPMMTTPTEPMLPNDSIGENGGNGAQDGQDGGQNGTNGSHDGTQGGQGGTNGGVGGENSRSTQRGRMRRIG